MYKTDSHEICKEIKLEPKTEQIMTLIAHIVQQES